MLHSVKAVMNEPTINHMNIIVSFLSFILWLGAFILSYTKNHKDQNLAREFRFVSIPFAIMNLYELIGYYIMNQFEGPYPEWANALSLNLYLLLFTLSSWRILYLAAAMRKTSISKIIQKTLSIFLVSIYLICMYLLQLVLKESISPVVFLLFCIPLYCTGFIGAIILLLRKRRQGDSAGSLIFAGVMALMVLFLLEDFLLSIIEDGIVHIYGYILFFLFFLLRWVLPGNAGKLQDRPETTESSFASDYDISLREQDVLELLLSGETRQSIAEKLYISENTVKTHISNIYKKMNIASRSELFALFSHRNYKVKD